MCDQGPVSREGAPLMISVCCCALEQDLALVDAYQNKMPNKTSDSHKKKERKEKDCDSRD